MLIMNDNVYDPQFFSKNAEAICRLIVKELEACDRRSGKVLVQHSIEEILRELNFSSLIENGGGDLPSLAQIILRNSNHLHHPHYMGHQVAVPMLPSSLGDLLNGATNNGMAVYEMGPAQTAIEKGLIHWMLSKSGWESTGDGVLTHGGSLANLSALLTGRGKMIPESWDSGTPHGFVLLASEAAHYSVSRAAAILGLGASNVIKIAADKQLRMDPNALKTAFQTACREGKKVLAVSANAGATPNGAFDPLREIGGFCRNEGIWMHVDGAHGGSALISKKYRALMDGIELADSLVWDMHKMLATSVVCGAALFREKSHLQNTYAQHAPYLFSDAEKPGEDLSKITFECTKAPLSLKLFFNLAVAGEKGMASHIEKLFENTRKFHDLIATTPGFECFGVPQANILCFRYGRDSELQDRIRQRLVLDGEFYITRTTVRGESYLRIVIMNPRTTENDIEGLCRKITDLAKK
jgi:L-2,4-diaminobutyrate decarboxylase